MRSTLLALGLLALPFTAAAAPLTATLPVTRADVASDQALAALYQRIEFKAQELCGEGRYATSPLFRGITSCTTDAVSRAVATAGIAPLSTYHAQQQIARSAPAQSATLAAR